MSATPPKDGFMMPSLSVPSAESDDEDPNSPSDAPASPARRQSKVDTSSNWTASLLTTHDGCLCRDRRRKVSRKRRRKRTRIARQPLRPSVPAPIFPHSRKLFRFPRNPRRRNLRRRVSSRPELLMRRRNPRTPPRTAKRKCSRSTSRRRRSPRVLLRSQAPLWYLPWCPSLWWNRY